MSNGTNNSGFVCVDAASSTEGCPTPPIAMSEDMPIREKMEETLKEDDDSSDNNPDETEETNVSHDNHVYVHHIEHHPISGRRYMIRTRNKPQRILVLSCGALKLMNNPVSTSGFPWICNQYGNWWGFRNIASGTFLGHDGAGKVVATNTHWEEEEYFVPVRQEGGGYILHTYHPEGRELLQVAEDDDGISLVEVKDGGTAFDFIDVKYLRCSVSLALPNMEEEILLTYLGKQE